VADALAPSAGSFVGDGGEATQDAVVEPQAAAWLG
jgi:hypothetical protein